MRFVIFTLALLVVASTATAAGYPAGCIADIDRDGTVNVNDLNAVLTRFDQSADCSVSIDSADCRADITGDGTINVNDQNQVVIGWGTSGCYNARNLQTERESVCGWVGTDTAIFVRRDPTANAQLGTCTKTGSSCTSHSACGGDDNFCVLSTCEDNGTTVCASDADCIGRTGLADSRCSTRQIIQFDGEYPCHDMLTASAIVADSNDQYKIKATYPPVVSCSQDYSTDPDSGIADEDPTPCRNGLQRDLDNGNYSTGHVRNAKQYYSKTSLNIGTTTTLSGSEDVLVKFTSMGGDGADSCISLAEPGGAGRTCLYQMGAAVVYRDDNVPASPGITFRPAISATKVPGGHRTLTTALSNFTPTNIDWDDSSVDPEIKANAPTLSAALRSMHAPQAGYGNRNTNMYHYCSSETQGVQPEASCYHRAKESVYSAAWLRGFFCDYANDELCAQLWYGILQNGIDRIGQMQTGWTCFREKGGDALALFTAQAFGDDSMVEGFSNFYSNKWGLFCASSMDTFYRSPHHALGTAGAYLWGSPEHDYLGDKWTSDPFGWVESDNSYYGNHVGQFLAGVMAIRFAGFDFTYGDLDLTAMRHVVGRYFMGWDADSNYACGPYADPNVDPVDETFPTNHPTPTGCTITRNCTYNTAGTPRDLSWHGHIPGKTGCSLSDKLSVPSAGEFQLRTMLEFDPCIPGLVGDGTTYSGSLCAAMQ